MAVDLVTHELVWKFQIIQRALSIFNDPRLQPGGGKTWCNVAVQHYSALWGHLWMRGKLANDLIHHIDGLSDWKGLDAAEALAAARHCRLVLGVQRDDPHGHVTAVLPATHTWPLIDGWKDVPLLSMGKKPLIMTGARWAFKREPRFVGWLPKAGGFPWS